jgi:hypothetical protein
VVGAALDERVARDHFLLADIQNRPNLARQNDREVERARPMHLAAPAFATLAVSSTGAEPPMAATFASQ